MVMMTMMMMKKMMIMMMMRIIMLLLMMMMMMVAMRTIRSRWSTCSVQARGTCSAPLPFQSIFTKLLMKRNFLGGALAQCSPGVRVQHHCPSNQFSQSFDGAVSEEEFSRWGTCSVLARGTCSAPLSFQSIFTKF